MTMSKLSTLLRKLVGERPRRPERREPRRRDPQFVGRSSTKEIENAPPERVGELVGHAPERVDT
jgi:hypothetical protein